jgi:anti-sigma factor RsiW
MRLRRRANKNSDILSCSQLAKVLQAYLDKSVDEVTAKRAERHLEACRRCGLEAKTYARIKIALAHMAESPSPEAVARAQEFAEALLAGWGGHASG